MLRPDTRRGDVVAIRDFFGERQHSLVDNVACTTVWGNSDFRANCSSPGNTLHMLVRKINYDREKNKFATDEKSSRPVSGVSGDHVLLIHIPFVMEDGGRMGD